MKTKHKNIFKRIASMLIALVVVVNTILGTTGIALAAEKNEEKFQITMLKLSNLSIYYLENNVVLKVKNISSEDFSGKLTISFPALSVDGTNVSIEKEISVSKDEEKEVSFYVQDLDSRINMNISLTDRESNVWYDKLITARSVQEIEDIFEGNEDYVEGAVLTSKGTAINNPMHQLATTVGDYNSEEEYYMEKDASGDLHNYDEETFPDDLNDLYNYRYIIVSNIDLNKLNDKQWSTLVEYISNGGTVIIGTGANAQKTLARFSELITYKINGVSKITYSEADMFPDEALHNNKEMLTASYRIYEDIDVELWDREWRKYYTTGDVQSIKTWDVIDKNDHKSTCDFADIEVSDECVVEGENSGKSICVRYQKGQLRIYGVDFTDANVDANITAFYEYSFKDREDLFSIPDAMLGEPAKKMGNPWLYVTLCIVCIVSISLIAYLVLKKMDKRQYIWLVMPCMALVFSIVFYCVNKNLTIEGAGCYYVTTNVYGDGQKVSSTILQIVNTDNGEYEFDVNTKSDVMYDGSSHQGSFSNYQHEYDYYDLEYEMSTSKGDNSEAEKILNDDTWKKNPAAINISKDENKNTIKMSKVVPFCFNSFEFMEETSTDKEIKLKKKSLQGEKDKYYIVNELDKDLKNVIIASKYGIGHIGDMGKGQEIELSEITYIHNIKSAITGENSNEDSNTFVDPLKDTQEDIDRKHELNNLAYLYFYINRSVIYNENELLVIGCEESGNSALGDEWRGYNIAVQRVMVDNSLVMESSSLSDFDRIKIGYYDGGDRDYTNYTNDESIIEVIDKYLLELADVPNGLKLKQIEYNIEDNKEIEEYVSSDSYFSENNKGMVISAYDYAKNEYVDMFKYGEYGVVDNLENFYGDDKPLRIKYAATSNESFILPKLEIKTEVKNNATNS